MVPKMFKSGKSFKKCAAYLLHDAEMAKTAERIKWTHALNTASESPGLVVDEMLWTYRAADDLKRQAGLKAGRPLEHPVRHFSLNWHTSENPTREHMIETVQSFLAHMTWQEHQALIVCHNDKHPHVHVMVNAVHPETGRALNSSFEKRRAQEWAKQHERENGRVFCEERLKPVAERTPSPTRQSWEKLRKFERQDDLAELARLSSDLDEVGRASPERRNDREWKIMKEHQREERVAFFADGKEVYRAGHRSAYLETREEFRAEWGSYYKAKRCGMDQDELVSMKNDILERQSQALEQRSGQVRAHLRALRDEDYKDLLARQNDHREQLRVRQKEGRRSYDLLDEIYPQAAGAVRGAEKASPGEASPSRSQAKESIRRQEAPTQHEAPRERFRMRDRVDVATGLGIGALGALASIGERLFDGLLGGGEVRHEPKPEVDEPVADHESAHRATASQTVADDARAEEEAALRASWDERRRRKRERD